ncbi:unnamed protein product [Prunus armeniaca]
MVGGPTMDHEAKRWSNWCGALRYSVGRQSCGLVCEVVGWIAWARHELCHDRSLGSLAFCLQTWLFGRLWLSDENE